ncbi:MAG: putative porin, partial [Blastocatellia bacterium]|nr:putative porin [Blastocatellia bacterium]
SASEAPAPPLQHVQNVRARYRLRFNFDTDLYPTLSFHGQLATGPINSSLTLDQDFTSTTTRHPFFLNEAWVDYHPNKSIQLQAGRVQEVFADNSRFLFDDDVRFNGFNEKYIVPFKKNGAAVSSVEFRAGQYILTNPNVAIIAANSPLAHAGEVVGTSARSSNLFHQGVLINQQFNKKWSDQIGADIQIYRHPNQIQLASTAEGLTLLIQPGLGLALSGPLTGTGNATTTPGGAIYTAEGFDIARLSYRLNYAGFKVGDHNYPVTFNAQVARNLGTGLNERDAMLLAMQVGRIIKRGDKSLLYVFSIKGANSLISQVTDDDLGTGTGVNIRTHHLRFEYGLARKVTFQSLFFLQRELRSSGDFPNFFVPLSAFTPRSYRFQQQLVFAF